MSEENKYPNLKKLDTALTGIALAKAFTSKYYYTGDDMLEDMLKKLDKTMTDEEYDLKYRKEYTEEELQRQTEERHSLLDGLLDLDLGHGFLYNLALEFRSLTEEQLEYLHTLEK